MRPQPPPPWQPNQPSYGLKLLLMALSALLLIVALVTLFTTILSLGSVARGQSAPGNPYASLITFVVSALLLVGSVFGLLKLRPYLRAPANFSPSYGAVAAEVRGHPFEVRYQRVGWGRTMRGKGLVRFEPAGVQIEGERTPSLWLQLTIILVLTVLPLILFQVGLGLIPALVLAYYLGRTRVAQAIPYAQVSGVQLAGGTVRLDAPGSPLEHVAFAVATSDDERLYGEVSAHLQGVAVGGARTR